jgi:hypothetical protein
MGWRLSNPIKSFSDIGSAIIKKPGDLSNWKNLSATTATGGWATSNKYDKEKEAKQASKEAAQNQAGAATGFEKGSELWSKWTGITPEENAADAQKAREISRNRVNQTAQDPQTAAIMANKAGAVASAQRNLSAQGVKGAVAQNAVAGIERQKQADVAASLYGQAGKDFDVYREMISNSLTGSAKMASTQAAMGIRDPSAPKQSSWIDDLLPV